MDRNIILIADDDEITRQGYRYLFRDNFPGYNTEFFENGKLLKARLKRGVENVALLYTDKDMPELDGLAIIEQFARSSGCERIPFILTSNDPNIRELEQRVRFVGGYAFVDKFSDPKKIIAVINEALHSDWNSNPRVG